MDQVEASMKYEMEGTGKLLGYRAMQKKLRQVHDLFLSRDLVHAVMYNVDPTALEERAPQFKQNKRNGHFISKGTDWVHSLDGHDILMATRTVPSHWLCMGVSTHAVERCCVLNVD